MAYIPDEVKPVYRIAVYGDPKVGKTPFVGSLPFGGKFFKEAVYIAADDGSETLSAIPRNNRKFLHVVKPGLPPGASKADWAKYDPVSEAAQLAIEDWQKKWPDVNALIWDTMSETADITLSHIADKNQFSGSTGKDKHVTIGDPGGEQFNLPVQGDYGGAQNAQKRLQKKLFRQPLYLFVLYHTAIHETESGQAVKGGPATVGTATIRTTAKPFDAVIRLEKKTVVEPGKPGVLKILAHNEAGGIWIGGVRGADGPNPWPLATFGAQDPFAPFWPKFFKTFFNEDV